MLRVTELVLVPEVALQAYLSYSSDLLNGFIFD